jgi:hypothetical protein
MVNVLPFPARSRRGSRHDAPHDFARDRQAQSAAGLESSIR